MIAEYESQQKQALAAREAKLRELLQRVELLPKSLQLAIQGELATLNNDQAKFIQALNGNEVDYASQKDIKNYLYGKVCFRTENYLASTNTAEKFDAILCLSTIKYVHLNFGDVGLKALFLKAYEQLTDNGILIIDPQPWKSYKHKKKLSARTQEHFPQIQLKPNLFKEYLESIGFKLL